MISILCHRPSNDLKLEQGVTSYERAIYDSTQCTYLARIVPKIHSVQKPLQTHLGRRERMGNGNRIRAHLATPQRRSLKLSLLSYELTIPRFYGGCYNMGR